MNVITQVQFWTHVPTRGGHLQIVRASDGYTILLDRTSGILTLLKQGEPQVVEVSPSAWISLTSEPRVDTPPQTGTSEETTKVWTKPQPPTPPKKK